MKIFDALIVGSGAGGLFGAKALSELGFKVAVMEKSGQFAAAATTRNEGWLHNGTYHSYSIKDEHDSLMVAQRCQFGFERIRQFTPEAIHASEQTYAVLKTGSERERLIHRWSLAGVAHQPVCHAKMKSLFPGLRLGSEASFFAVSDKGIHTGMLCAKLVQTLRSNGVKLISGARIRSVHGPRVVYEVGNEVKTIHARMIIYTVGAGAPQLASDLYQHPLPVRMWKSHLIITKRVAEDSLYCLDPGEMTMINHGETSIFGFNDDAKLIDRPSHEPDPENIAAGFEAIRATLDIGDVNYLFTPIDSRL